jgi:hypothetical protein
MDEWNAWLSVNWAALVEGAKLEAPSWLCHPLEAGFSKSGLAENVGQAFDYVLADGRGGRFHIHEFSSGKLVVHRDRVDPSRGLLHGLWHWLSESSSGRSVAALGAVAGIGWLLTRD